MRRIRLMTAVIGVLGALAAPANAFADSVLQWSIDPRPVGQPTGATAYTLSTDRHGVVRYGHQTWGIDLVFGGAGAGQWEFRKVGAANVRDHRTIAATESVALYNRTHHEFLAYGYRYIGADLVWSATPRYQWKVSEGPARAKLYNTAIYGYLIDSYEHFGIDLAFTPA